MLDLDAERRRRVRASLPAKLVSKRGPAALYSGVPEPRNFGHLVDIAIGLGASRGRR